MGLQDISPYIGRRCQVMVQCQACGRAHVHEGTLNVSRQPGELQLDHYRFTVGEVRALIPAPAREPAATTGGPGVTISRRAFDLLWQAVLLLSALSALHALR